MEKKTKKRIDPASESWDLFTKTGEISYYMLYKKLTKKWDKMEEKLNGIVLSAINYGENDKILSIFTLEQGIISAIIKGVKKASAKLKFASEPFRFAEFVFSVSTTRRVVINASLIDSFYQIREDIVSFYAGATILEFIKKIQRENIISSELFLETIESLKQITYAKESNASALVKFLLNSLATVGYGLSVKGCFSCHTTIENRIFFDCFSGAFFCEDCAQKEFREIKYDTYLSLKRVAEGEIIEKEEAYFALKLLEFYLENKVEIKLTALDELIKIIK